MARQPETLRSPDELRQMFRDAFEHLRTSSELYDKGRVSEAPRLATTIYIFAYDHGKSNRSLLRQVGRKDLLFRNSIFMPIEEDNLMEQHALALISIGGENIIEYQPFLGRNPIRRPNQELDEWWSTPIYIETASEEAAKKGYRDTFTRRECVEFFRNKQGGAHVDPVNPKIFAELQKSGFVAEHMGQTYTPKYGMHYASIRQIAFELQETLITDCSDILAGQ